MSPVTLPPFVGRLQYIPTAHGTPSAFFYNPSGQLAPLKITGLGAASVRRNLCSAQIVNVRKFHAFFRVDKTLYLQRKTPPKVYLAPRESLSSPQLRVYAIIVLAPLRWHEIPQSKPRRAIFGKDLVLLFIILTNPLEEGPSTPEADVIE